jgi:hypothetical protein
MFRSGDASEDLDWYYTYLYGNSQVGSSTWLGPSRYAVLDVTAHTAEFGSSITGHGMVTAASFPRLNQLAPKDKSKSTAPQAQHGAGGTTSIEIESQLSAFVMSAVRHVFVPDIEYESLPQADKILIPIIVLRNHNQFNPLASSSSTNKQHDGQEYFIDVDAIKEEVSHLLSTAVGAGNAATTPFDAVVVSGVHSLHTHGHISLAVAKSMRSDSVHTVDHKGRFTVQTLPYLDSTTLLHQLKAVQVLIVFCISIFVLVVNAARPL